MSVKNGLLAILSLGDCHGYQLKYELTNRTGSALDINIGQIYSTLERLERDGLVKQKKGKSQESGQQLFSITSTGRREANLWLQTPVLYVSDMRHDLATKLALAVTLPGVDVAVIVNSQRAADMQLLQSLTLQKRSVEPSNSTEVTEVLLTDRQIFSVEAELRWLDHIEEVLKNSKTRGLATNVDLSTYEAKRGRPSKAQPKHQGD
jgi:DNA-binding PadR family transcriptional regulator